MTARVRQRRGEPLAPQPADARHPDGVLARFARMAPGLFRRVAEIKSFRVTVHESMVTRVQEASSGKITSRMRRSDDTNGTSLSENL